MPLYRFHLVSQAKVIADAEQESPAKLAQDGHHASFISATVTAGDATDDFTAPTRVAIPFQHIELIEML